MRRTSILLGYLLLLVHCMYGDVAPELRNVIQGQVLDSEGMLPGATVHVKNTLIGTMTDPEGRFMLTDVPSGEVVIVVRYIGYESQEEPLLVSPGRNDAGLIHLSASGMQLQEVVIKGEMLPSQMKAYNMKLNSSAIVDMLASDAIGKLPDRNAAEAVQRLPGVAVARYHGEADRATVRGTPFSWTSTLFNGTRLPSSDVTAGRSAVLDVIPSELIEYAKVSKALTPDMEADAIGGSIDFITRTAPLRRTLNVSAAGGYNGLAKREIYNFSAIYGDRFLNDRLGIVIAGSTWKRNWGTDEYTMDFQTGSSDALLQKSVNSLMMKRYMGSRTTNGLNLGLEYTLADGHKLYMRSLLDQFIDDRPVFETYYMFNADAYQYQYRESRYNTLLYGGELGGRHSFTDHTGLDWSVSDYYTSYKINSLPENIDAELRGLPILTFTQGGAGFGGMYTHTDGKRYKFSSLDAPSGVGDDPDQLLPHTAVSISDDALKLQRLVIMRIVNIEEDLVGQLNLTHRLDERISFKAGVKFRNKSKSYEMLNRVYMHNGSLGMPVSAPVLSSLDRGEFPNADNFFSHSDIDHSAYALSPPSSVAMQQIASDAVSGDGFTNVSSKSDSTNRYDGHENVFASYLMGDWSISEHLKLYGGIRHEYTQTTLRGAGFDRGTNALSPTRVTNNYHAFLPMLHLKYTPADLTNIRMAYTRTFVRPLFGDITPGTTTDITPSTPTITRGNGAIRPAFSDNFDLMYERFFGSIGILSGGIFGKVIHDYIYSNRSYSQINGQTYYVTEPRNLSNPATLFGIEFALNRRLEELPGLLRGLGIEVNGAWIHSEAEVPCYIGTKEEFVKTSLPNQSSLLFNAILYYELNGLTVKLAGNFRGRSLETINSSVSPDLWIWTADHFSLDLAGSYAITNRLRLFCELQNLTDAPVRMYLGDPRRTKDIEWSSRRGQAGLRFTIF